MSTEGLRVAFEVGGTFIDVVIAAADGPILTYKILALPDTIGPDVGRCVQDAMTRCGADGIARMVHATTVASNTVLEGKGAVTGLVCTRGFRDLTEIRGLQRPAIYDIFWDRIPPLVPRRRRLEVTERIMASGAVRTPLEEGEVRAALHSLRAQGTQAVAVCFLHSYVNSGHERRAMALVREIMPEADACSSAEVLPEIREYPRASTTVLNAYLMGAVNGYLGKIERELSQYGREILIMQSNGGIMTAAHAPLSRPNDRIGARCGRAGRRQPGARGGAAQRGRVRHGWYDSQGLSDRERRGGGNQRGRGRWRNQRIEPSDEGRGLRAARARLRHRRTGRGRRQYRAHRRGPADAGGATKRGCRSR